MSTKSVILIAIVLNAVVGLLTFLDPQDPNLRALAFFGIAGALAGLISLLHANVRRQAAEEARDEALAGDDPSAIFQAEAGSGIRQRSLKQFERAILPAFVVVLALLELGLGLYLWRSIGNAEAYTQMRSRTLTLGAVQLVGAVALYLYGSYIAGLAYRAGQAVLRAVAGELVQLGALAGVAGVVTLMRLGRGLPDISAFWGRLLAVYLLLRAVEKGFTVLLELYRPRRHGSGERLLHESRIASIFAEPRGVLQNLLDTLHYQFGIRISEAGLRRFLRRGVPALLLVELAILLLASTLVFVQGDERVVLERFGRPLPGGRAVLEPGMHLKLPWPVDTTYRVSVSRIQQVHIGADTAAPADAEPVAPDAPHLWTRGDWQAGAVFLTATPAGPQADRAAALNLIALKATVSFTISDPQAYLYSAPRPDQDVPELIRHITRRELAAALARLDLDSALTRQADALGALAAERLQERADTLQLGIHVVSVVITSLQPPPAVAPAFEDIFSSDENRQRDILASRSQAIRTTAQNSADIQKVTSDAGSYSHRVILQSEADAAGFLQLYEQYRRHPRLFSERLYLSTLERALATRRIIIVPAEQGDRVITIDLKSPDMTDILNFQKSE